MTVSYEEYSKDKSDFLKKHGDDGWRVETSGMDRNGKYHKEYICSDDHIFYEVNEPEFVEQEIEVKGCRVTVSVKLFRTEYWSSDNAKSKYYYEPF